MKTLSLICICALLAMCTAFAQRGQITIPIGAQISIPTRAQLCADRYYANNPGYGTLSYGNDPARICGSVIPVDFLSLSASHHDGIVTLRWQTASEAHCAGFEVQRSTDQALWQHVGYVPGHGTTMQEHCYIHEDALPVSLMTIGTLFYRLRQVDFDGAWTYSPVVNVSVDTAPRTVALHAAYPNPATDRITVRYSLPDAGSARIAVYAMTGQQLLSFGDGEFMDRGEYILSVNISALSPGGYILKLRSGDLCLLRPFVVRR
ncbi:MAG: T9SS type A sorting domain-containing protein [Bacteroidia bacterium]|nr:T9SS type A sorting domain-containing protein [Bacteroidia bacterium]